jgi:cyclic pyranopterin phosphate synthase
MTPESPSSDPRAAGAPAALSHIVDGPQGPQAAMVDVSDKAVTQREALAQAVVRFPGTLLEEVLSGKGPKGPVLEVSRTAGILAAKRTGELIPLCHPLALDLVEVHFAALDASRLEVRCRARCNGRTGVEMEALTGAAVAALTIYDMCKARSHEIEVQHVRLLEKRGGRSGVWSRRPTDGP